MAASISALRLCFPLGLLAVSTACRPDPSTSVTALTSGEVLSQQDAVVAITAARCDREAACERLGPLGEFATRPHCEAALAGAVADHLPQAACPSGVRASGVRACAAAVRSEPCDLALGGLGRLPACQPSAVCVGL